MIVFNVYLRSDGGKPIYVAEVFDAEWVFRPFVVRFKPSYRINVQPKRVVYE